MFQRANSLSVQAFQLFLERTGYPRPMFTYWPDVNHLWGVEMWITSTSTVRGQPQAQTAHSECFLRNL